MRTIFCASAILSVLATQAIATECKTALKTLSNQLSTAEVDQVVTAISNFKTTSVCNTETQTIALRRVSGLLAQKAQKALASSEIATANSWLDIAPSLHWLVQVSRADIAATEEDRPEAARLYNSALDTLLDPQLTPAQDKLGVIADKIVQLAQENTMLAGTLEGTISRGGDAKGVLRALSRGITFEMETQGTSHAPASEEIKTNNNYLVPNVFVPVRFDFNSDQLDEVGRHEALLLATFLTTQGISKMKLTGHTDEIGSSEYNLDLSKRRAKNLAGFLKLNGVTADIVHAGKGESAPPRISDPTIYTDEQRRAIARRVELSLEH